MVTVESVDRIVKKYDEDIEKLIKKNGEMKIALTTLNTDFVTLQRKHSTLQHTNEVLNTDTD